jgi:hypothetical protein
MFGVSSQLYALFGNKSRSDCIIHTVRSVGAVSDFAITLSIFPSLIYIQTKPILLMRIPLIMYIVMKRKGSL